MGNYKKTTKKLGEKVKRLRKKRGITQEELADLTHISRPYMGYIEQGRRNPSLKVIARLARVLRVPVSELFKF